MHRNPHAIVAAIEARYSDLAAQLLDKHIEDAGKIVHAAWLSPVGIE